MMLILVQIDKRANNSVAPQQNVLQRFVPQSWRLGTYKMVPRSCAMHRRDHLLLVWQERLPVVALSATTCASSHAC